LTGPHRLPLSSVDLVSVRIRNVIWSLYATGCALETQGLLVKMGFMTCKQSNLFSFLLPKKKKKKPDN